MPCGRRRPQEQSNDMDDEYFKADSTEYLQNVKTFGGTSDVSHRGGVGKGG